MFAILALLFIVVPLVEVYLLFVVASHLGFLQTVAIVLLTGMAGASLARWQGLQVMRQLQRDLAEGRMPGHTILSGILVLVGAVLLVTPGILTDAVGLLLMIPPVRYAAIALLKLYLRSRFEIHVGGMDLSGSVYDGGDGAPRGPSGPGPFVFPDGSVLGGGTGRGVEDGLREVEVREVEAEEGRRTPPVEDDSAAGDSPPTR